MSGSRNVLLPFLSFARLVSSRGEWKQVKFEVTLVSSFRDLRFFRLKARPRDLAPATCLQQPFVPTESSRQGNDIKYCIAFPPTTTIAMMETGYEMTLVDVSPEEEGRRNGGSSASNGNGSASGRVGGGGGGGGGGRGRKSRGRSAERESEKIGLLGFGGGFGSSSSSGGEFGHQNSLTPRQQSWAVVIKLVLLLVVAILLGATLGAVSRLASSLSGSGGAAGGGGGLDTFEVAGDDKSWLRIYLSRSGPQRVLFRLPQASLGKLFIRSDLTEHGSGHGGLGVPSNIAHTQVDGENPALFFNVSSNGAAIDLYRKQLEVRTSVPQDGILLREGGTDQWIQQFDVLELTSEGDVVFEVTSMVLTDVFYLNFAAGAYPLKELQLFQSFPRNSNFIVQSSNPSTMATTSGECRV